MNRPSLKAVAITIILGALGVGAWITVERAQSRHMSDTIIGRWDRLDGEPWLLPDLDEAIVYQPDRPHSFQEVHAWRQGEGVEINRVRYYALNTNGHRLRGPQLKPKRRQVKRVIAIGDSVTHGWGVSYDESFPQQLEAMLSEEGWKIEVINAGVPANPVSVMEKWCTNVAPGMKPDIVIWARRSAQNGPQPVASYARAVQQCKRATGADVVVALPPVSTFDVKGSGFWETERNHLAAAIGSHAKVVMDLTPHFRKAQKGRGEILEKRGDKLVVVDQETNKVWIEAQATPRDLPPEIYALFEKEPDVREALFFDEGHPDAEGFKVFAAALLPQVRKILHAQATR
jgi:hypothetical protein